MEEKVFVAVPAEPRAGRSTLSWALGHLCGGTGAAATVVVVHVHVPPQMIPVSTLGGKFHASKLSPEQVRFFRTMEREKANKLVDDYLHQCSKMKVKCEKLVIEKEDVASGLVELIGSHGITKLVISAAADRHYSRKLDRPMSKTAAEVMQRADPSCKIWFVCKEQLICTRDNEVGIAPSVTTPLLPNLGHEVVQLSTQQGEDGIELELGFYDELKEACRAAGTLMERALGESRRRQKAEEEAASSLQKAKQFEELYLEELTKRKELEGALARATGEIAELRQTIQQAATPTRSVLEQRGVVDEAGFAADHQPCPECAEALLGQKTKLLAASTSPSSVIPSLPPPTLGEDGFTADEADVVRCCWLACGEATEHPGFRSPCRGPRSREEEAWA